MEFDDYLKEKKIDPLEFKNSSKALFEEWKSIFDQISPDSFTQQKLFLINKTRRAFPFKDVPVDKRTETAKAARPKIPIKPKIN